MASNVGVSISVALFFTAVLSQVFLKTEEKREPQFFVGFMVAMAGICLVSFNGSKLERNPIGDILAVAALGIGFTLIGLFFSEGGLKPKKDENRNA